MVETRNTCTILVGRTTEMQSFGRPKWKRENDIKMDPKGNQLC
jgi:hypothetical protein